ncbi:hypothetical protein LWC34_08035 [Kibdelosporangium philippinense]|uniref:Uncharacterized protein n=1 Tax=Kibdelosporangium philippinense TaxID=211113 RepID=A0ABS8Z4D0_9PSEU|nr:hypothetical protein [Kibdelosporangium philippinense]MCE7002779.1 hypothetical protein [Kibdelosporangium philippinense]
METARVRELAQLGLPGFAVGFFAGAAAGLMAGIVGQPIGWAMVAMLTLGVPLGVLGAVYSVLVALGKVRIGQFAPAFLFWLIGFPLARLSQEVLTRLVLTGEPGFPPDVLGFLAYQGLISAGFAFGFLWMHERLAPQWWRRLSEHNPAALRVYERYASHARVMWEAREARKRRREASKAR